MTRAIVFVIALVALAPSAAAQAPGGRLRLEVFRPIRPAEVESLVNWLKLSEGQAEWVLQVFDEHLARDAAARERLASVQEKAALLPPPNSPLADADLELYSEIRQSAAAIRKEIGASEDRFFDSIVEILADSQLLAFTLARDARVRKRSGALARYPGANVDLVDLVHAARERASDWEELDADAVNAHLLAYSATMTSLFRRSRAERDRLLIKSRPLANEFVSGGLRDDEAAAIRDRMKRLRRPSVRIAIAASELNEAYLSMLTAVISPESAALLRERLRLASYPPVYPDPFDPFGFLSGRTDADDSWLDAFRSQYDAVNDAMVQEYMRWSEVFTIERTFSAADVEEHEATMRSLLRDRVAVASSIVATAAQIWEMPDLVELYEVDVMGSQDAIARFGPDWPRQPLGYIRPVPPEPGGAPDR